MPLYVKDAEEKAKFMGAKVNSVVVFNHGYEGAEAGNAFTLRSRKNSRLLPTPEISVLKLMKLPVIKKPS